MMRTCGRQNDPLSAKGFHDLVFPFGINDDNIRVFVRQIEIDNILLCKHGFTRSRHTRDKGISVEQLPTIDHNEVFGDRVIAKIDALFVADLLHTERHEGGKAFGGQRSADAELGTAVWQGGIQPLQLLPTKNRHGAEVLSRTLLDALGICVKLLFGVSRMHDRNECRDHTLVTGYEIMEKLPAFLALAFHVVRNASRKIVVLILLSLPIGDIGFHRQQLVFSLPYRLVHRDRLGINGKHEITVNIGQLGNKAVLDKVGVIFEIEDTPVTSIHLEMVTPKFHALGCNGNLKIVSALDVQDAIIAKIVLVASVEEIVDHTELFFVVDLCKLRSEGGKKHPKFGFHTSKICPCFLQGLFLHGNGQIFVLHGAAGEICVALQDRIVFVAVSVKSVAHKGDHIGLFKLASLYSAVVDRDLGRRSRIKTVENIRIGKE